MMRALLIGGTGLLGSALREARPDRVAAFTHYDHPAAGSVSFSMANLSALSAPADLVISVFPLARSAAGTPEETFKLRCHDFARVLHGKRVIVLSTDAVFDGNSSHAPHSEYECPDASSEYGRKQSILDNEILECCPRSLVIRTSFLFGSVGNLLDKRLGPFLRGESLAATQRWPSNIYRSPTEVHFCAEGVWRAVDGELEGVLNICGQRMSIADFFWKALSPVIDFPRPEPVVETQSNVACDSSLDSSLMRSRLQLEPEAVWEWYLHRLPILA
jgi:dTDP-4-dehydrorhamnose reductase